MINTKDKLAKAQTEKNGICSRRRSEFSRDVLKEDFRTGLREIDETVAQERDPESFDPTQQLRSESHDRLDKPILTIISLVQITMISICLPSVPLRATTFELLVCSFLYCCWS